MDVMDELVNATDWLIFYELGQFFFVLDLQTQSLLRWSDCPNRSCYPKLRVDGERIVLTDLETEISFRVGEDEELFFTAGKSVFWKIRPEVGGWLSMVLNRAVILARAVPAG